MYKLLIVCLFLSVLVTSCDIEQAKTGEVIATAFGNKLYKQDILPKISARLNAVDSQNIISRHVDNWLMEEILYNEAKRKVNSKESIEKLVGDYRKSLFIHELEKVELTKNLDTTISIAELDTFYALHKEDFLLDEGIVKLLFVKVPEEFKNDQLETLWKTENIPALKVYVRVSNGLELLELDKWHFQSEINYLLPAALINKIDFSNEESYSLTENGQHFLLKVLAYVKPNELAPKSFAMPIIKQRLLHDRSNNLLNTWKKELYQNNIKSKDISITIN